MPADDDRWFDDHQGRDFQSAQTRRNHTQKIRSAGVSFSGFGAERRKAGITFTKEGNCFTHISDAAGLAKIAETLSRQRTTGRLSQVCERWIYTACLCFVLDRQEQKRSRFHYQYSNYQIEYSRNLVFEVGGHMDQVFQALIDRSRAPLDLKTVRTILGYQRRPRYRKRKSKSAEWEVAVERPAYDLTSSSCIAAS